MDLLPSLFVVALTGAAAVGVPGAHLPRAPSLGSAGESVHGVSSTKSAATLVRRQPSHLAARSTRVEAKDEDHRSIVVESFGVDLQQQAPRHTVRRHTQLNPEKPALHPDQPSLHTKVVSSALSVVNQNAAPAVATVAAPGASVGASPVTFSSTATRAAAPAATPVATPAATPAATAPSPIPVNAAPVYTAPAKVPVSTPLQVSSAPPAAVTAPAPTMPVNASNAGAMGDANSTIAVVENTIETGGSMIVWVVSSCLIFLLVVITAAWCYLNMRSPPGARSSVPNIARAQGSYKRSFLNGRGREGDEDNPQSASRTASRSASRHAEEEEDASSSYRTRRSTTPPPDKGAPDASGNQPKRSYRSRREQGSASPSPSPPALAPPLLADTGAPDTGGGQPKGSYRARREQASALKT
mmetsp:Transcript_124548/g.265559  ORF Transcript_124548/g.265559 Transcript_124548/m.265559 type:complete len:413 (+) Transcript_124548:47-1285(+)